MPKTVRIRTRVLTVAAFLAIFAGTSVGTVVHTAVSRHSTTTVQADGTSTPLVTAPAAACAMCWN